MDIVDSLPIVVLVITLAGAKVVTPITGFYDNMSLETTKSVKAVACLTIILHHLAQARTQGVLFREMWQFGVFSVAIFFYYSGYGMMKKYMIDRTSVFHIADRLLKIAVPYMVITAITLVYDIRGGV